jgi:hypothetical protein
MGGDYRAGCGRGRPDPGGRAFICFKTFILVFIHWLTAIEISRLTMTKDYFYQSGYLRPYKT